MKTTIYHNPRCSKSRETLALLQEKGIEPEVILYQQHPPTLAELQQLVTLLQLDDVRLMMRTKDDLFAELGLDKLAGEQDTINHQLLQAIVENPSLLERPIVVRGQKAKIGRPPELVLDIL
ncbi:arsenate reductase (glutaredoxin) [Mergibacter septicus]|uniref:arsenate reductase (glutaredoxin) n=1 Tax=Mergibacter septicus TaxID=221402 RepID=UPI00117963B7|nr:arsenate reductase (glutaredoxin) [Mergibacter septicus]AWX14093.1 arsenate reductase (glutaredoxin) [Mergibacter septicus]